MKRLLQLLTTLGLVLLGGVLYGQNLEFTLRYNIPLARYEVYARPSATNATFAWGPSQISIVAPAIVPDAAFTITSVSAGAWQDNSLIFAPAVTPGFDYHGVGSLGAPTNLMMNVEKLIFHFTIAGGCYDGLRLFINGSDPNSAAAGMGGGDFSNTVSDGLAQERYIGNYNNTGTLCNNPPVISSNGGGPTASVSVPENTTAVTTVVASDPENDVMTYSISGGADAALFTIDPMTGVLTFLVAPDFENPTDAGLNNIYDVQVKATDPGGLMDIQDIAVTVTNVNENPMITSNGGGNDAMVSIPENTTAVTTVTSLDPENGTVTYSITGGADAALFSIDPMTGVLVFNMAPDFENPTDAGLNNVYDVQVTASDGNGGTDVQSIAVTVTNVNEAPSITSNGAGPSASISVPENTTPVTTVTATDPENAYGTPKFSITGGADAALFTIDANTGALAFISGRDFENPTDAGLNNVYDVQVTVTDAGALTDVQNIAVTVTNVDENGRLRAKVLLQGALLGAAIPGVMRDDLRSNGYVPLNDPYTLSGNPRFAHAGGGGAASTTNVVLNTDAGTPDAIVDWVFVELRSSANSSVVLETRAALVQRDGDVVSPTDGDSPLEFTNMAGTSFFVSIKHRNHLGVMTASAQTLTVGGTVVDFTTMSNANVFNNAGYDGAEMITIGAVKALWAGNANADVKVKYQGPSNDNATILAQVLTHPSNVSGTFNFDLALGYFSGDINMDGKVKYQGSGNDPAFIFANIITNYTLNLMDLYNYDLFLEQLP